MKKKFILILIIFMSVFSFKCFNSYSNNINIYKQLSLTDEEIKFLRENKVFYYGITADYAPIEFIDSDGNPRGFGIEYLKKASELLNIQFIPVHNYKNMTWSDCIDGLMNDEIDLLPTLSVTPQRLKYTAFTKPYLTPNIIIVGNNDEKIILKEEELEGSTIALPNNYWQNDYIKEKALNTKIINTLNIEKTLSLINKYKADYSFMESTVFNYYNQINEFKNIKIVGELDIKADHCIGVNKNKELLASILDKVIDYVPKDEVYQNALYIDYSNEIHKNTQKILFISLAVIFAFIILTTYLYKKLGILIKSEKFIRKSKETLIENLSHDLKTPIAALKINIDLLKHGLVKDEQKLLHYRKIDNNLNTLNDIINELNEITHLKDFIQNKSFQHIVISDYLEDIYYQNIDAFNREHKILLLLPNEPNKSVKLKIERTSMTRAINNLLNNSLKFTNRGDRTVLSYSVHSNHIIIKVTDTGVGIAKKDLNKIFDRFYKVSKARNTEELGKGLGLAITKDVVELHNGKISVTSDLGKETTFTITLPR